MRLNRMLAVSEAEITAEFDKAAAKARALYAIIPKHDGIDPEAMAWRNDAMAAILGMVQHLGTEEFRPIDIRTFLQGTPIRPIQDWPLFTMAHALEQCHAGIAADSEPGQPLVRTSATLASLLPLVYIDVTTLGVRNIQKRPWSDLVHSEIQRKLAGMGAVGTWSAGFMAGSHTLVTYPEHVVPQEPFTVQVPIWFELRLIDDNYVHISEANTFRVQRALEIEIEQGDLFAKITALAERQRKILTSYEG